MYASILNYICCPKCRGDLQLRSEIEIEGDVIEGILFCECGHTYRIIQGIADFNTTEQGFANQWESMGEAQRFEDIDRDMDIKNPTEITQRRELVLNAIVDVVTSHNCKTVLDIASGRGLLLTELAKNLGDDIHIISIDLSSFVLKYDYKKFKQIAPSKKISYLACDATNLPLKDGVVDAATSYGGFSNMLGCASEALQNVQRVIKSGGVLVDSYVVIKKKSEGYETLHQVCMEQHLDGAEEFFLHDELVKHHEDRFSSVKCNTVFEGIGIGNGMDLLPYDGEWYAEQVLVSQK